ncbi:hypothetical protein EDC96DRAFT_430782, partial [Choanephora cucurbitarum]
QIRLKRLAKLQQQQQQPQSSSNESKPTSSTKTALPTLDEFVPLKKPTPKKTSIETTPQQQQQQIKSSPQSATSPVTKPAKSFEEWQDDVLSRVLQVTLNVS